MLSELADIIERQFQHLSKQNGVSLVRELRRTLGLLHRTPRIAALLDAEREEALDTARVFLREDHERVKRLIELRRQFGVAAPDLEKRDAPIYADIEAEMSNCAYHWDDFDAELRGERRIFTRGEHDQTIFAKLSRPFTSMLEAARWKPVTGNSVPEVADPYGGVRPELVAIADAFRVLTHQHEDAWRIFYDSLQTEAGYALLQLERLVTQLGTKEQEATLGSGESFLIFGSLPAFEIELIKDYLYGQAGSNNPAKAQALVADLSAVRAAAERVHHGLLLRIGTTRSLLAVFERFRGRCQWHDRERLLGLAQKEGGQKRQGNSVKRGRPEQLLTEELARYLFDQGLNPLTEVPMAGLRPDLYQPGSFYVEAKQYIDTSPKRYLLRGIHQMYETMGRIRTSEYEVTEAFYVVFRRGGPLVEFGFEEIRFETWTLRPLLIDIAPATSSGSRAQPPIRITEEEARAQAVDSKGPSRRRAQRAQK